MNCILVVYAMKNVPPPRFALTQEKVHVCATALNASLRAPLHAKTTTRVMVWNHAQSHAFESTMNGLSSSSSGIYHDDLNVF